MAPMELRGFAPIRAKPEFLCASDSVIQDHVTPKSVTKLTHVAWVPFVTCRSELHVLGMLTAGHLDECVQAERRQEATLREAAAAGYGAACATCVTQDNAPSESAALSESATPSESPALSESPAPPESAAPSEPAALQPTERHPSLFSRTESICSTLYAAHSSTDRAPLSLEQRLECAA